MNIEQKTAYPSRYADEPEVWDLEEIEAREKEEWQQESAGKSRQLRIAIFSRHMLKLLEKTHLE